MTTDLKEVNQMKGSTVQLAQLLDLNVSKNSLTGFNADLMYKLGELLKFDCSFNHISDATHVEMLARWGLEKDRED